MEYIVYLSQTCLTSACASHSTSTRSLTDKEDHQNHALVTSSQTKLNCGSSKENGVYQHDLLEAAKTHAYVVSILNFNSK